jgi:hypothetical protein
MKPIQGYLIVKIQNKIRESGIITTDEQSKEVVVVKAHKEDKEFKKGDKLVLLPNTQRFTLPEDKETAIIPTVGVCAIK